MRIVDVCAFYAPEGGGVKTYVDRKLKAACGGPHEVIIVAPGERRETVRRGSQGAIITLPAPRLPLDRRYRYFGDETSLHKLLDSLAPDVVEASSPWASPLMVARWRGRAVRSLVMHADPMSAYAYRWFGGLLSRQTIDRNFDLFWQHLRRLDQAFDLVVSASESLTSRLRAGGLGKVETLPMGVEPGIFAPAHRDEALRRRLLGACGLDEKATLLVGAGRLASEKRWPMVIEAVTSAGYAHSIGLVLLGDGRDRAAVLRAAANNPHVLVQAPIHERSAFASLVASADALVHGCESETFCMVAAEAKASGIPLLVPDEGGAADHFVAGQGRIYEARSAAALAAAIKGFIEDGAADARSRARAGSALVPDMNRHFERLFAAYEAKRNRLADAA